MRPARPIYQYLFFRQLCNITSKAMTPPIKTFVFFDLETTGLPYLEHNLTKITELCAVAVQADHLELGCFPRVQNKLSLCFNPRKLISAESTDITGLSNNLLEHQNSFTTDTVDVIKKWLEMNRAPICLVAHNGNRFDYPIFRSEILNTGNSVPDLYCIDSLTAFRQLDKECLLTPEKPKTETVPFEFDDDFDELLLEAVEAFEKKDVVIEAQKINETTPRKQILTNQNSPGGSKNLKRNYSKASVFSTYKLGDVYKRLTGKSPISAHEADGDVTMLITCAAFYAEKFVKFSNENAVLFNDIAPMKPGRKL